MAETELGTPPVRARIGNTGEGGRRHPATCLAEEDVGAHSLFQAVVDRAQLELDPLERAEGALGLVAAMELLRSQGLQVFDLEALAAGAAEAAGR